MKTIGIIGGGQLGLMIIEQEHLLGARTVCLDPAADAPAFALSDERIVAAYDDPAALEELCRRSDVVTYEFENVPGDLLVALEQKYNIKQGFRPLFDSQDRLREKSNACDHGLKTPAFMAVDDEESLHRAIARIGYPCVLKTRTLGYDGHGQAVLRGEADLAKARELLAVPCILEEFVPFDFEASVVLVSDGERVICFPVGRNIHKDGILDLCLNVVDGLVVYPKVIEKRLMSELPFMATENIMMDAVKAGGDRQELHERIRELSMEAGKNVKEKGLDNNLLELIAADDAFNLSLEDLQKTMDPSKYVGRSKEQVEAFLKNVIRPILDENKELLGVKAEINV